MQEYMLYNLADKDIRYEQVIEESINYVLQLLSEVSK